MLFRVAPKPNSKKISQQPDLTNLPTISQRVSLQFISSVTAAKIYTVLAAVSLTLKKAMKHQKNLNRLKRWKKRIWSSKNKNLLSRKQRRTFKLFARNVRRIPQEDIAKIVSNIYVRNAVSRFTIKEKGQSIHQILVSPEISW